jgi:hypothetical protein
MIMSHSLTKIWIHAIFSTKDFGKIIPRAFSVSESDVEKVSKYIINQHEHHKKMTFIEEYNLFMKKYGINP